MSRLPRKVTPNSKQPDGLALQTPVQSKLKGSILTPGRIGPPRSSAHDMPSKPVSNSKIVKGVSQLRKFAEAASKNDEKFESIAKDFSTHVPWTDKHHPNNLDELFVNRKKVDEVVFWLLRSLDAPPNEKASKICVLSGPSGSGKTACIMTIAKVNNIAVKEWINPSDLTEFDATRVFTYGDEVTGRSQTDLFSNFLFRSSQYSALPIKGRTSQLKCVTVVEDFPNAFYKDTSLFHNILRNLSTTQTPVVFIIGDTSASDNVANKLFPNDIRNELGIRFITFNAVAASFLVKYLTVVSVKENINLDKSTIEEIAAVSGGDMRSAINSLQFAHQKTLGIKEKPVFKRPFPVKQNKGAKKGKSSKDEHLFLFHALGKVLYGKRNTNEVSKAEYDLVDRLVAERRIHPPNESPEELCNTIEVSAETFVYFLQQNYVQFFTSLEECTKASAHLADSEYILSNWAFDVTNNDKSFKVKDRKEQIAVSVATRGLMHSNTKLVSNSFLPLRKPICNDLHKRIQKSVDSFHSLCSAPTECLQSNFYTDYFPYFAKIKKSSFATDKRMILDSVTIGMGKGKYRMNDTHLDHNFDETKEEVIWSSQSSGTDIDQEIIQEDDLEFQIEEYDD